MSNVVGPGLWPHDVSNTGRGAFCVDAAGAGGFCGGAAGASDTDRRSMDKATVVMIRLECVFMDMLRALKPRMDEDKRR